MRRARSSIRSVSIGFAGLLLLMGGIVLDSARQTRDVSRTIAALRKESRGRDELMDQLRNDTYRSATLARDYMLENDENIAQGQRTELLQLRSHVEESLRRYGANAPPNEKEAVQSLKERAISYWNSLAPALDWNRGVRQERGEKFLRTTMIPRRNEVVQFARQVTALNERMLDAGEEQVEAIQNRFQTRVRGFSTLALASGILLAVFVIRHVRKLAEEADTRFNQVLTAQGDLRRLSDRLVTVQEEERRLLSRELHDELGQTMSAILLEIGKLDSTPPGSAGQRERLASVRRLAEENVAKVRDMALLLRPAMLDELGLVPALRWHAKEVSRRTGLRVKMIADELDDELPDANRTCIYRVVQEALNNCVKHSKAKEVRVVIQREAEGLMVSVQDDGVGFNSSHSKGLGLLGMMERVSGLGGRFNIESGAGRGTILSTYFPLIQAIQAEREKVV